MFRITPTEARIAHTANGLLSRRRKKVGAKFWPHPWAAPWGEQTCSGWGYGETRTHGRTAGERASCGPPEAQQGIIIPKFLLLLYLYDLGELFFLSLRLRPTSRWELQDSSFSLVIL